jgi:hypothetical protein
MTAPRIDATALATVLLLATAPGVLAQSRPDIPFAPIEDTALKDPDNPAKKFRIDFARVEHDVPLTREHLMRITPENIAGLTQEEFDQLYGRLAAGPIPDGQYAGDLFFSRGDRLSADAELGTRLEQILGGVAGRVAGGGIELLEKLGRELWKGKVFFRDERILRNMIDDELAIRAITDPPRPTDTNPPQTREVPADGLFGRRFRTNTVWLLFPAKLYCGQSLVDGRRESVIVDYNYNDEGIKDYRRSPDSLAGRGGLRIRDEIRMIRPGFYLGRAYTNRIFLLNFTLFNADVANREGPAFAAGAAVAEDCWPGEQARKIVVR